MNKEIAKVTPQSPLVLGAFSSPDTFDQWQRMALALASSTIVPEEYRGKDKVGNCLIALNMSQRMNVDVMMLMQNMDMIKGKPALSSKFLIGLVNGSGKFSPIRFEHESRGVKKVNYWTKNWDTNKSEKKTLEIEDLACRAYAVDLNSGDRLDGIWITIEMAVKESWYQKKGSKWPTMPTQMLQYRAASFWTNTYYPEGKLGMPTQEEVIDTTYEEVKEAPVITNLNKMAAPVKTDKDQHGEEIESAEIVEDTATDKGPKEPLI